MACIKICLKSIMMRFGVPDFWEDFKETNPSPTKSALIGMIGAALGIPRGHHYLNDLYQGLTVYLYQPVMDEKAIRPSIMDDFQTAKPDKYITYREFAQNKFNDINPGKRFPTADGNKKDSIPTTTKQYIENGQFTLFITGKDDWIEEIGYALDHPYYPLYIGNKNCVPSKKINNGILKELPKEAQFSLVVLD